jgi:hypothetical protein
MMLNSCFKGLRLVIQYVGKAKTHFIVGEYDRYVIFPLLVHVCKVLNSYAISEIIVVASTMNNLKLSNF